MRIYGRFGDHVLGIALNLHHLHSHRHQRQSLEMGPTNPHWPLQRTGSMSEGQARFPSKSGWVAIITISSVCLWQSSSKGSLTFLDTKCDVEVRMWKPLHSTQLYGSHRNMHSVYSLLPKGAMVYEYKTFLKFHLSPILISICSIQNLSAEMLIL